MIRGINNKCKKLLGELQIENTEVINLLVKSVDYCNRKDIHEVNINLTEIYRMLASKTDRSEHAIKGQLITYMKKHAIENKELYVKTFNYNDKTTLTLKKFMILLLKNLREQ